MFLEADDVPMGVHPISMAKNHFIQLHHGDVLVVGTDGLIQSRHPGEPLNVSYDRMLWKTGQLAHQPAHSIADSLFNSFAGLGQAAQEDDQTLVVIKCA